MTPITASRWSRESYILGGTRLALVAYPPPDHRIFTGWSDVLRDPTWPWEEIFLAAPSGRRALSHSGAGGFLQVARFVALRASFLTLDASRVPRRWCDPRRTQAGNREVSHPGGGAAREL